ncbi:Gp15 family bacteriophage protein [Paenibacillus alvei]|uniref:Gp15 family bacteriophage protein n=1 Tax=Paenibacillus alvei TaxID=44250 RepID=UPI000686EAAA|nr:Gp15 family bacteriophage protein [Paenibacillus alvei]
MLRDFNSSSGPDNWYDLREDWPLIEASLAKQYGIRIRQHGDMPWEEFCTLVSGLMPDTPLGSVVTIRAENDPKVIKGFNADQKRIYNGWRKRRAERKLDDQVKLNQEMQALETAMARMFGGGVDV